MFYIKQATQTTSSMINKTELSHSTASADIKNFLKVAGFSLLLTLVILTPMRGGYIGWGDITGYPLSNGASLFLFAMLSWALCQWKGSSMNTWLLILAQIVGGTGIYIVIHLLNWHSTLVSFPENILSWIGILSGIALWKGNSYSRPVILSVLFIATLWVIGAGTAIWLAMVG